MMGRAVMRALMRMAKLHGYKSEFLVGITSFFRRNDCLFSFGVVIIYLALMVMMIACLIVSEGNFALLLFVLGRTKCGEA